jgi:hypothetical protein
LVSQGFSFIFTFFLQLASLRAGARKN